MWRWGHALVWLLLAGGAAAAESDQQRATRLYRAGELEAACKLFARVAAARPNDGAAWADLGLCEGRLGRKKQAIAHSLKATQLDDREARLNAYFNLHRLGVRAPKPLLEPRPTDAGYDEPICGEYIGNEGLACDSKLAGCVAQYSLGGNAFSVSGSYLRLGSRSERVAELHERVAKISRFEGGPEDGPESLVTQGTEEALCGYGAMHVGWECMAETDAGEAACAAQSAATYDSCVKGGPYRVVTCDVVVVNPCLRRIGYVCHVDEWGTPGVWTRKELQLP